MCKCRRTEERYRPFNQILHIYTNSNLIDSENGSEFSNDSEKVEEVLLKSNEKGNNPKYSSESILPPIKDKTVPDMEKFDGTSTQLRGFLD